MSDIDPSGVQIQQSSADAPEVSIGDYQHGGLSGLSTALASTSPELHDFLGEVAAQGQAKAASQAMAAALANGGEAGGDAVRSGKLQPTQSYWFMKAYATDAAQIRSRSEVSALVDQSQTWAERSDPVAYQARFSKELGAIAGGYTNAVTQEGFKAGALPIANQALAVNEEYNVQRITQEHQQNVSTLMTQAIQDTAKVNGGVLTPEAAQAVLAPLVTQWSHSGGTLPQARTLMLNSIVAAAANTGNTGLLDVLKQDFDGHGPLADMASPSGQPVAEDLLRSRYYIDRLTGTEGSMAQKAAHAAIVAEGSKGSTYLQQQHGFDLLRGKVSAGDLLSELQQQGYTPQGAAEALNQIYAQVHDVSQLGTSLIGLRDQDPDNATTVGGLYERATRLGYSPQLEQDIQAGLRKGILTKQDVDTIDSKAAQHDVSAQARGESRAEHVDSEARAGLRWAAEQHHIHTENTIGAVIDATVGANDKGFLNPQAKAQLSTRIRSAGEAHLARHPNDYTGAAAAEEDAANAVLKARLARLHPGMATPPKAGNPLGGSR